MRNTKLKGLIPFVPLALVFFLALLLSWPNLSRATLTVSNTGLQGDTNITLDTNGTLGVGTASATAITIGQSSLNVLIPGSLTVSSATTTVNNLRVTGSCLGCGSAGGIAAINGLSNATTSIAAGSGIAISTSSPNIITISATGAGASSTWSAIANPTGNLSLSMGNFTTTFTAGSSTTNPFLIQDTTGNTGTGPLFQVSTFGTSVALPVKFTAQGTSNGVQMNASGTFAAIGTGNINGTQLQGIAVSSSAPTTNQVLTYNGSSWAPANASSTGSSGITAINGLSNATTSLVAGTNITIATSSPNIITISASGGSGSTTPGGSNTQLQFNNSGVFGASPNLTWLSPALTIGQTGTTTGQLKLAGSTSGTDTIQASSTAGTWTLTLPTSAGSAGYVLSTDGSGNTSWIAQSGGGGVAIDGLTNSAFNFTASGTGLSIATTSPNTVAYTWTNPGYLTASSTVTWTNPQTFDATSTFLGPIVESGSGAGYAQLTEGSCPTAVSGADILCANSSHVLQLSLNGGSFLGVPQLTGDLGNTVAAPEVVGIQGIPVSTTTPTTNQVLTYNGTKWAPATVSGSGITAINGLSNATTSLVAGTNITIATSSPNVITISASGGSATPAGTSTQLQFNSAGAFGASANLTWLSPALTIGQTGTSTGQIKLAGSTSGTDTIQASSTAGTWTMTLPTSAGTAGYVLSTDGSGNTSWIAQSGGSGITAINGLTNSTTTIAAGSGITIATSTPNIITITATGGGASSTWSGISNPTGNLSLNMANFTTTFTVGATTTNPFLIQDTTGNTGTGPLLQVNTVGTSAASPVEFTAQGTSNGVQMNTSGTLAAIGTGNINATQLQGITISTTTPTTNQVLTYNGTIWAPAAASSGSTFQITGSTPNENENGQNWLGISTFPTSETQAQWPMAVSGHITGMYINLSVAPGAASSTSWTLRLNKASQALQCSISGTSTSCSTTGSVAVSPGNLMDIDELSTTSPASSYITWAIAVGP